MFIRVEIVFLGEGEVAQLLQITTEIYETRINDIAIAMSYSSCADPGLRGVFKCLNV